MNERNIFIVRAGEAALKGENKPYFERMLAERIKKLTKHYDNVTVERRGGLTFVYADRKYPKEEIIKRISMAFGVQTISPAVEVESDMDAIGRAAVDYMKEVMEERNIRTFKVRAKRADKQFPVQSPDIARKVGAYVLKGCKVLKVDVHDPDVYLYVDVRKGRSYIYQDKIKGFGGLPLGTNGKGLVLLSGGIDSPVAAFMMARRGMAIEAVHFHSYPYTSERAREKVEDLASQLAVYCSRFKMHTVNLLPVQEQIVQNCPEEETTIHVRMFMMRIAEKIAGSSGCDMLITGESLGQVASQTAESLVVTNSAVDIPVMRPLIALDKTEIIKIAQDIDTYETSIQPYEDCCTVFLPKHPVTKPKLDRILESEKGLDIDALVSAAAASEEVTDIYPKR
ncbi:MAG: tRNA uracil 4-sulfurtransferase ThiI [Anaerovoracaceae bacterium]|nr:tRNA uracil 4-sulfurtransferase ThiI [Anaerovoracaceae bacterium]